MSFVTARFAARLEQPDLEHLTGIVPLVHGRVDVQPLITLQPDQLRLENSGERAADVGLPDTRFAFDEQRAIEREGEIHRCGEVAVGDVPLGREGGLDGIDRCEPVRAHHLQST